MKQRYSILWTEETRPNDFVYYIQEYDLDADSEEQLGEDFRELSGKAVTEVSTQDGILTYKYLTQEGLEFTDIISYAKIPLEELAQKRTPKKLPHTLPKRGYSDYFYTRYFMPKWSTAYRYNLSTHSKVVEPVFTHLTTLQPIEEEPFKPLRESLQTLSHLVSEEYLVGSSKVVSFGRFTTVYLYLDQPIPELELVVSGLSGHSFVETTTKLKGKGYIKLPVKFSKISSIQKTSYNIEKFNDNPIFLTVSNCLPVKGFVREQRMKSVELVNNRVVLYNTDTSIENVFSFNGKRYQDILIDAKDRVWAVSDGVVHKGYLDADIAMNVPKDVSSNNNAFIETLNLDMVNYKVTINIKKFVIATGTQSFAISVEDSKGEVLYLDRNKSLTSEKVFLSLSDIFQDTISLNLEMEEDLKFISIKIEDWDNLYPNMNIITQPILNLVPVLQLPPKKNLSLLDGTVVLVHDGGIDAA